MTTYRYLLPALIGMLAGISAAVVTEPQRQIHSGPEPVMALPGAVSMTGADAEAVRIAFPGDDGRIARLFSALQQPAWLLRYYEVVEALNEIKPHEISAFVRHLESSRGEAKDELFTTLVERWFELDPAAARDWALTSSMEWSTVTAWGRADPAGAFDAAIQSDQSWAPSLLSAAMRADDEKDMRPHLQKVRSLPPGPPRDRLLAPLIVAFVQKDPAAAYAAVEELSTPSARDQARYDVLRQWAREDPAGVLPVLEQMLLTRELGAMGHAYVTEVAQHAGRVNPGLVLRWLENLPSAARVPAGIAVAGDWATKEPIPAVEWCMANGIEITRPRYLGSRGEGWQPPVLELAMRTAPQETLALLNTLPQGADRDRLLECAFVASLKEVKGDHLAGPGWSLYRQLPEEAQIENARVLGIVRARQGEPHEFSDWLQNFPAGAARSNAVTGALADAALRDSVYGKTLLGSLTTPADRDAGLRGMIPFTPPAAAAPLALEISDPQMRKDALEGVVTAWLKKEPAAARDWIDGATAVPTSWKQEWLRNR